MSRASEFGKAAEMAVAQLLRQRGRSVVIGGGHLPYDLIVDGWRVDVKASNPRHVKGRKHPRWTFDIRHCWAGSQEMSFYILRMEKFPIAGSVRHALFKAPIKVPTVTVSLVGGLISQPVKDFELFAEGKYGKGSYIGP